MLRPKLRPWIIGVEGHGWGACTTITRMFIEIKGYQEPYRDVEDIFSDNNSELVNLIILEANYWGPPSSKSFENAKELILRVRKRFPYIAFILYFTSAKERALFLEYCDGKFNHYLYIYPSNDPSIVDSEIPDGNSLAIRHAETWITRQYDYDVAMSFAGEDRALVEDVATRLKSIGVRIFYDEFEQGELLGRDLYQLFQKIYKLKSRYAVVFVSKHYAAKAWTSHELKQMQSRAFRQNGYILPIRIDDSEIPGVNETIGYIDSRYISTEKIANILINKIFYI